MDIKSFFRSRSFRFVLRNILIAVAVGGVLLLGLYFWLRHYTQHGIEVEVPNVVGMYIEEALPQVNAVGMQMQVIDSTYSNAVPLGAIVEQTPVGNSHAKKDRMMYVVVNAKSRKQVVMPDLHDISYRQAASTLRSIGIRVNDTYEYEPSEYKDLVLEVKQGGKSVAPGERIEEGSMVTLVVGFGKGTEMVSVPSVTGLKLQDARSLLLSSRLTVGSVEYDEPVDSRGIASDGKKPVVYMQTPLAGEQLLEGSMVGLKLSTDVEKTVTAHGQDNEEEFF